jgi:proline racemase/trans-L-3-hydroxyproline dehydratase
MSVTTVDHHTPGEPFRIVTEIVGMAYRTGGHTFELDSEDPLGTGFVLR